MPEWTTVDWTTAIIFVVVASIGICFWIKYLRASLVQRASYLIDVSADVRWGFLDILIVAFCWFASQALVYNVLAYMYGIPDGTQPPPDQAARFGVIIGMTQLIVIGLGFAWLAARFRHSLDEFGMTRQQLGKGVRFGLIAFAMLVPIVWSVQALLVQFIEYTHPSFQRLDDSPRVQTYVDAFITAVIVAPFVEEIMFRGFVQGWLQRIRSDTPSDPNSLILGNLLPPADTPDTKSRKKPSRRPFHPIAIVVTSILFGLAHFSQGPAPVSLFVLSLGLGYLYQRTGSLVACIVVHMLLNAVTMSLLGIELFIS